MQAYERARCSRPRLYQSAVSLTIIEANSGDPYWGTYHCAGVYIADPDLCKRAQRALIERDHLEALRRNDWMDRQELTYAVTETGRAALDDSNTAARSA